MQFTIKDSFNLGTKKIVMKKISNYGMALDFRSACLPICFAHLRPVEIFLSAMLNQYAPMDDWGLTDSMIQSEKEVDSLVWPAFKIMMSFYEPIMNEHDLDEKFNDIDLVYELVHSQMSIEKVTEHCIKRKLTMLGDVAKVLNIKVDFASMLSAAETAIVNKITEIKLRRIKQELEKAG